MSANRLKIGISAGLLHPDKSRTVFAGKTLQFVEQSMAQWVMSAGALPVMVPAPDRDASPGEVNVDDYAEWLDGLVLHGGADVWPGTYGEQPLDVRWNGDRIRDEYEQSLVKAFVNIGKPVLGVCRGLQLLNVAFGGTLYQDIGTQLPRSQVHRDSDLYDSNFHRVEIVPNTKLANLLVGSESRKVNSIHHQAVKDLAPGFIVEARCPDDGVIEAIRYTGSTYVAAVQWHPEYHLPALGTLDDRRLLQDFLAAAGALRLDAPPQG